MHGEATRWKAHLERVEDRAAAVRPLRPLGRFGEYEVIAPIARGGSANVYLAVHVETGERVALKVLDPAFASVREIGRRLLDERRLASVVKHPGIVEIRDARVSSDQLPYLVMEYLDGETLAAVCARGEIRAACEAGDVAVVTAFAEQIASALAALHAAGVVHCDVKPENVFVQRGRATIIDFGLARRVGEPFAEDAGIAGTPWCMAPEQWEGRPQAASDVYALGCMLYDLTTGRPPFDGSLPELMLAHLEQRPARPSWLAKLPLELERWILRALAKDPADRPTMAELAWAMSALTDRYSDVRELRACG